MGRSLQRFRSCCIPLRTCQMARNRPQAHPRRLTASHGRRTLMPAVSRLTCWARSPCKTNKQAGRGACDVAELEGNKQNAGCPELEGRSQQYASSLDGCGSSRWLTICCVAGLTGSKVQRCMQLRGAGQHRAAECLQCGRVLRRPCIAI